MQVRRIIGCTRKLFANAGCPAHFVQPDEYARCICSQALELGFPTMEVNP